MSAVEYFTPVRSYTDPGNAAETTEHRFFASRTRVGLETTFEPHLHNEDQLAWMPSGSMELVTQGERWQLRSDHVAWIPGGVLHEMSFPETGELISLYTDPELRMPGREWQRSRTLRIEPLAGALMAHLTEGGAPPRRRHQCRQLLAELLMDAPPEHDAITLPRDPRARSIALALLEEPDDTRSLEEWAASFGVSSKTLARAFTAGTGRSFREWRVQARLHVAARMLAGEQGAVQHVARAVGYESVSSFIAAFKGRFDVTPSRYANREPR